MIKDVKSATERIAQRHEAMRKRDQKKIDFDALDKDDDDKDDDRMGWPASIALISLFAMIASCFHSCFAH